MPGSRAVGRAGMWSFRQECMLVAWYAGQVCPGSARPYDDDVRRTINKGRSGRVVPLCPVWYCPLSPSPSPEAPPSTVVRLLCILKVTPTCKPIDTGVWGGLCPPPTPPPQIDRVHIYICSKFQVYRPIISRDIAVWKIEKIRWVSGIGDLIMIIIFISQIDYVCRIDRAHMYRQNIIIIIFL